MSLLQEIVCLLVRPYTSRELPGWGWLYSRFVGSWGNDAFWADSPEKTIVGKLHGYEMLLRLRLWSERKTFFLGRFYDLPTQDLMLSLLRPGDRFCDVGANVGMLTLLAARLVGVHGVVDAFEPNPDCCERIERHLAHNRIQHVNLWEVALAERPDSLRLSIKSVNSGEGTLADVSQSVGFDQERMVEVTTGDSILLESSPPPTWIKVDVEGFECKTLQGLEETLVRHRPLVTTEVAAGHLERARTGVDALCDWMQARGYEPLGMTLVRRGLKHRVQLLPNAPRGSTPDVLWIPERGALRERALDLVRGNG